MTDPAPEGDEIRQRLRTAAPELSDQLGRLAERWTAPVLRRLDQGDLPGRGPKTFNDPIWGTIELFPWEVLLLDSPLLQRLRGVRQLGMAHQVYHSAGHDRLEHTRGVVEAAERILQALERNAARRRDYGPSEDRTLPLPSAFDRVSIRLGALLHDIGHGPFSHATEQLIGDRLAVPFATVERTLQRLFPDVTSIPIGERIAAVLVMSEPLRKVFAHPNFGATDDSERLAPAVLARILGARSYLHAPYLSGIVSGPLDADKLDYMARDSYHAGLPVALDTQRLISKLEVVAVTPETVTVPSLRRRAETAPGRRYHDVGISLAGLGAYEQMIVGRVILYDRLYYHHKVRAAEAMVRKLIEAAEQERGAPFTLEDFFFGISDDGMIDLLGGRLRADGFLGGGPRARELAVALHDRDLYHRAYAVARRFMAGLESLPEPAREDTRIYRWTRLLDALSDPRAVARLEHALFAKARRIGQVLEDLRPAAEALRPEHLAVSVPLDKSVARAADILTRTEDGQLSPPNLFFDPERWSNAYQEQKQCGFVFAPRWLVPLVSLAARVVLWERFQIVMSGDADRVAKTSGLPITTWVEALVQGGLCSLEGAAALTGGRPRGRTVRAEEIRLPPTWLGETPDLTRHLAEKLRECLPEGLLPAVHSAFLDTLHDLTVGLETLKQGGAFQNLSVQPAGWLRQVLHDTLRERGVDVAAPAQPIEGLCDLRVRRHLVVEARVREGPCGDPFTPGPDLAWQERGYAPAVSEAVTLVVLAYQPAEGSPPLGARIAVLRPEGGPPDVAEVRIVVPMPRRTPP